jgi:hypothetical protein
VADPKDSPAKVQSETQKAADRKSAEQNQESEKSPTSVTAEQSKVGRSPSGGKQPLRGAELDKQRRLGTTTGGTTTAAQEEYERLGVNPRLDNRLGDQRPPLEEYPAKPQQVPGPEVGHFAEHAEEFEELNSKFTGGKDVDRLGGLRTEGRHGLGERGVDETTLDEQSDH